MLSARKYIVTWLLTSSMWPINNLAACLRNTFQIILLWKTFVLNSSTVSWCQEELSESWKAISQTFVLSDLMLLIMTFLYNNTNFLIFPLWPEPVGVPLHTAASQLYSNAGQGRTHYEENPCSLSSFEAKLSHDPVITLNPYNKEQTMQVNLIQSNLFDYRELESGN